MRRPPVVGRDAAAQRLAEHRGLRARHAGQDQRELLTADARHQIADAAAATHDCRALLQRLISHRVAELVVHGLEAIEIRDCDAQWLTHRQRHIDLGREPLHEAATIGDAGQRVFL